MWPCSWPSATTAIFSAINPRASGTGRGQAPRIRPTARWIAPTGLACTCSPVAKLATRERLEVLACLTDAPFPDGEPLEDTLRRVWHAGGFPVMPWSRGKWLFARGRRVRRALESDGARWAT